MWNDLVTTALVGTERRTLNLDNLPETFRELASQLEGEDAEKTLLALAGALTLHRRVGQTAPLDATPLLDPCDLDDLPPCSPRAGLILQQILLMSQHKLHLQKWLTLATRRGQRVTEEYLPRLLTTLNPAKLPDHFYDVLGKRGRWLAQQNENWAYAVLPETDTEWQSSTNLPVRVEYLRRLRASDPAHGRALLESVWSSEEPETRNLLLQTWVTGLSLDDESFLEIAHDDRAVWVRATAVFLLAQLPASAYSADLLARARPLIDIHWEKHLLSRKLVITVTLPEWDETLIHRDVITRAPMESREDMLKTWLHHTATRLPLSYWLDGGWSPAELIQAIRDNESWKRTLLHALIEVARRNQSAELALSLLEFAELDEYTQRSMLEIISPATREDLVLHRLQNQSPKDERAFQLLRRLCEIGHFWSPALTRIVIDTLHRITPQYTAIEMTTLVGYLPLFAVYMSADSLAEVEQLASVENKSKTTWNNAIKKAVSTLEFRQSIHKEFSR